MSTEPPLQRGDFVLLESSDGELPGMIGLASPNGTSVIVFFDGLIGSYVGAMALSLQEDGQWRAIVDQMPVKMRRRPSSRD